MTQKYYMRLDESLASKLDEMEDGKIIEALESLAETEDESDDDLAKYDRIRDIKEDDSISEAERKRRVIRGRRRRLPR